MFDIAIVVSALPDRAEQLKRSFATWQREMESLPDLKFVVAIYSEEWDASDVIPDYSGNCWVVVHPNEPRSGSIMSGYIWATENINAHNWIFTGPEFLFHGGLIQSALALLEPNACVHHKCLWFGIEPQANIDSMPWQTPEKLLEQPYFDMMSSGAPQNYNVLSQTQWESNSTWMVQADTLKKMLPFPRFTHWGSDDPYMSTLRGTLGIKTITSLTHYVFHQNHPPSYPAGWGWDFNMEPLVQRAKQQLEYINGGPIPPPYTEVQSKETTSMNAGIIFPDHPLAHKLLDGLTGIEIGASAHNPFSLPNSKNVGIRDPEDEAYQIQFCGKSAPIDAEAEADELPFEANSQDYIISSHVFEHLPNPVNALAEWNRVVKDGGIVFMIVPKRDALESDKSRPLTTWEQWITAYGSYATVDNWALMFNDETISRRGHYYVYTPDTLIELIAQTTGYLELNWELIEREDSDLKVGNGFTLVYRVHKPAPAIPPIDPNKLNLHPEQIEFFELKQPQADVEPQEQPEQNVVPAPSKAKPKRNKSR